MERLETRRLMARDMGLDDDPGFPNPDDPVGTDPGLDEPPAAVSRTRPGVRGDFQTPESLDPPPGGVADITLKVLGGNIYLRETPGFEGSENGILITQLPNGVIRITGISANGGPASTINGAAFQDFAWSGNPVESQTPHLFVDFGDGVDRVEFDPLGETVNLDDVVIGVATDGADNSADGDIVSIRNLHARGILMVYTGGGADDVSINHATRVEGRVHLWTYTYDGSDTGDDDVRITGLVRFEQFLDVKLGGGHDDFFVNATALPDVQLVVHESIDIDAGAGDDYIYLAKLNVGGMGVGDDHLSVLAGAGQDTVISDDGWYENISIKTWDSLAENDKDSVKFLRSYVAGDVAADLGGGDDEFIAGDDVDPAATYGAWAGSILVTTGAGADYVHIEGSKVGGYAGQSGNLSIYTGAGADDVTVDFRSMGDDPFGVSITPEVKGQLTIRTFDDWSETDTDRVTMPKVQVVGGVSIGLGAGDDFFDLLGGGNFGWLAIDAGDGVDTGSFAGFIYQQGRIDMGAGADVLTLGFVNGASLFTLSGGEGVDDLHKTEALGVPQDRVFEYGWERINGVPTWQDDIGPGPGGDGVLGAP